MKNLHDPQLFPEVIKWYASVNVAIERRVRVIFLVKGIFL